MTPPKDPLGEIIASQKKFCSNWVDFNSLSHKPDEMQKWALDHIGHAIEELVELRRELPLRKHWKKQDKPLDFEKINDEYSDLLHFVINIGLVLGIDTSEKMLEVYNKKHSVVLDRHNTGY